MENDHLEWIFPLKIVVFHGYVSHYRRDLLANVNTIDDG